jgi:hypothetical protein
MADITNALSIPREALIGRLQEVHDEAESKRKAAQDAANAKRQALLDAVGKLSRDQVANLLTHYVQSNEDALLKTVGDWVEEKKFVSQDIEPTYVETVLERTIRVLGLASDEEVQVQPSDSIYAYL